MSKKRLLMVDDDPDIGDFVRDVATGMGFDAVSETTGDGFLARLDKSDPHIIILDLTMPKIDGIELLKELSNRKSEARIFIMSGYDRRMCDMALRFGEAGKLNMGEVIPKPVRAAKLREILAST